MTNHQVLDNITHQDLKIHTGHKAEYGDNVQCTGVFPSEFHQLQAHYPIFFQQRAASEQFDPVVLLGLAAGENLFLNGAGWDADYLPLTIQRQPFLIGYHNDPTNQGGSGPQPSIHIDMDSPRISNSSCEGEAVFLEHGGNSDYLQHINSVLLAIHQGHEYNVDFCKALVEFDLLEPFQVDITLADGSRQTIGGLYTINEEVLARLSEKAVVALHQFHYLRHIYMVVASTANLSSLIAKQNARL